MPGILDQASLRRAAVIAVGSNSTRMLTANLDRALSQPVRGRVETRLFLAQGDDRTLSPEVTGRLAEAVAQLKRQALDAGARTLCLIATSTLRDARNADQVARVLQKQTALPLTIISGPMEAAWSFLGAAYPYFNGQPLGVVDIGGGSTEIAVGCEEGPSLALSLQLGASRLYTACPVNRPGDAASARALARHAMDCLQANKPLPSRWLLVGGTGTALLGLIRGSLAHAAPDEPFTLGQAEAALQLLEHTDPALRALLPGMTPGREHILPTGLAILCELMDRLGIDTMAATARNNCDGLLYDLALGNPRACGLQSCTNIV